MTISLQDYNCPTCKSENTRKLSLIHRDGLSSSSGVAFINNKIGNFNSSNQTAASKYAAPPLHPTTMLLRGIGWACLSILIPGIGPLIFVYLIFRLFKTYPAHEKAYPAIKKGRC